MDEVGPTFLEHSCFGRSEAQLVLDSPPRNNTAEILLFYITISTIIGLAIIFTDYLMAGWPVDSIETFDGAWFVAPVGFSVWNLGAFNSARSHNEKFIGKYGFLFQRWFSGLDLAMGLDRAYFLLDLERGVKEKPDSEDFRAPIKEIRCESVRFAHELDQPVLNNMSLVAKTGTITAIVGSTGSGKSTLMSLLIRLYDPQKGELAINGTSLPDLKIEAIRSNIAIVLQQNVLFVTIIAENVAYATPSASIQEIERAAEIACARDFVEEMSQGLDTELG